MTTTTFDAALPQRADRRRDSLYAIRTATCAALVLCGALQCLFFADFPDNLSATAFATVSSIIGVMYALNHRRFCTAPVSALILFFYTLTATAGALLTKTYEQAALADRMLLPDTTFGVLLLSQLTLIAADVIYLRSTLLQRLRNFLTTRVIQPLRLLEWPPDSHLWLMGLLGCVSLVLTGTDHEGEATFGAGTAAVKLLRAFQILKFAPFLIPFRGACSGTATLGRGPSLVPLFLYFGLLVGISFVTNSRSTFADAIPTIGICLLLALGFGAIDPSKIKLGRILMIAAVLGISSLVLSRVALAMVVARDYRYFVDVSTLAQLTIEAMFNSEWLEAARSKMDATVNLGNYSEYYVDSRFMSRFLLTKFHDNIFYYTSLLGPDQVTQYRDFMWERLAATLPDPALRMLGINIDKQELVISNGDYLVYLVDGWGLGGFKTGSMFGEVYGIYGWYFPLILIAAALMLYVAYDTFSAMSTNGLLIVSPLLLMISWNLCGTTAAFGLGAETVMMIPAGVIRGLPQNVLIYLLAAWGVRLATRFFR